MEDKPLDLEVHTGETVWSVWKRRILFALLIALCIAFAAPQFGSCSGAIGTGGSKLWGTFTVGQTKVDVHENDFRRAHARYSAVMRLFDPQGTRSRSFGDDEVWTQLMLDEAAKQGGVHVSDEDVAKFISMHPLFQTNGRFDEDRYRTEMKQLTRYAGVDHESFTAALKSLLRTDIWRSVWASAYAIPQSREAFEAWSKKNVKVTVDYVVQPVDPLKAKSRELPVTDDDIRRARILPKVMEMLTVPARKGYEAAYVRVRDVTPAQREALAKFVTDAALLPKDQTLESVAWRRFWDSQKEGGFSRTAWLALRQPEYKLQLAAWEKLPEPRPPESKPKDPAAEAWPEKPADQFYKVWRSYAEADVLTEMALRHMLGRAERETKSLRDLLPDYERFGVLVTATAEPIPDNEFAAKFPEGLAKDSDLEAVVRAAFTPPAAGAAFTQKVVPEPVQVCHTSDQTQDRGWIGVRWTSYEPARERDVAEVRAQVESYYRDYRANDLARDVLVGVRTKADAVAGDVPARREALKKFAAEAGLEVRTLSRFNAQTEKPTPPAAAPGTPAAAAAERIAHRARVQDEYPFLAKLEPGKFRDPILLDERTGGAYLILVVEKHEPGPLEIDEATLRTERYLRMYQDRQSMTGAFSPAELKKRYQLQMSPEAQAASEKSAGDKNAE